MDKKILKELKRRNYGVLEVKTRHSENVSRAKESDWDFTNGPYIELNDKNQIVYFEEFDGSFKIWERDEDGLPIYWEDNNGYWQRWESAYDINT